MLTVLGGLAEFERDLIRTRTGEGRERAKARGVILGRKPKLTVHQRREAIARRDAGEGCRRRAQGLRILSAGFYRRSMISSALARDHFPFVFSQAFLGTRLARYSGSVAYRSAFSLPEGRFVSRSTNPWAGHAVRTLSAPPHRSRWGRRRSFPLRLQLRPFQRQSDHVGACLDGANRSIQFCRDHFGARVRFRHSSKEDILLSRPPVGYVTTIFPLPSALAANG